MFPGLAPGERPGTGSCLVPQDTDAESLDRKFLLAQVDLVARASARVVGADAADPERAEEALREWVRRVGVGDVDARARKVACTSSSDSQ